MDFADLDAAYFADAVFRSSHSGRMLALGRLRDVAVVAVVFRPLGTEAISIVSMRPASSQERKLL